MREKSESKKQKIYIKGWKMKGKDWQARRGSDHNIIKKRCRGNQIVCFSILSFQYFVALNFFTVKRKILEQLPPFTPLFTFFFCHVILENKREKLFIWFSFVFLNIFLVFDGRNSQIAFTCYFSLLISVFLMYLFILSISYLLLHLFLFLSLFFPFCHSFIYSFFLSLPVSVYLCCIILFVPFLNSRFLSLCSGSTFGAFRYFFSVFLVPCFIFHSREKNGLETLYSIYSPAEGTKKVTLEHYKKKHISIFCGYIFFEQRHTNINFFYYYFLFCSILEHILKGFSCSSGLFPLLIYLSLHSFPFFTEFVCLSHVTMR